MILRPFFRQRLMVQFSLLMTVLGLLVAVAFMTLRYSLIEVQALQRARTVANMVDAFGAWASQYKGVWVRSDPADTSLKVGDFLEHRLASKPSGEIAPVTVSGVAGAAPFTVKGLSQDDISAIATLGAYHSKNPALVQRELSQVVSKSESAEKFRMTSDRYFNQGNAPTPFERTAIETIRGSEGKVDEYVEVKGNTMLYARRLVATGPCMRCHDTPEKSPVSIQTKYAGTAGWGYTLGGVAGVISVTVPMSDRDISTVFAGLGWGAWVAIAGVAVVVVLLLLWLHLTVIGAASKMEVYANRVKSAQRGEMVEKIQLDAEELTSRNEVHKLAHALKAIARALNMAQKSGG